MSNKTKRKIDPALKYLKSNEIITVTAHFAFNKPESDIDQFTLSNIYDTPYFDGLDVVEMIFTDGFDDFTKDDEIALPVKDILHKFLYYIIDEYFVIKGKDRTDYVGEIEIDLEDNTWMISAQEFYITQPDENITDESITGSLQEASMSFTNSSFYNITLKLL